MIVLNVTSESEKQIVRIASILLQERLAIDVNVRRNLERAGWQEGSLRFHNIHQLTAKSKALLFTTIQKRLQQEFAPNMPELYSIPIVNMDWEQAEKLVKDLQPV